MTLLICWRRAYGPRRWRGGWADAPVGVALDEAARAGRYGSSAATAALWSASQTRGGAVRRADRVTQGGSSGRPGACAAGSLGQTRLIDKDDYSPLPRGNFFSSGHLFCFQRRITPSSRSRARPVGLCTLQPSRCSSRHTEDWEKRTPKRCSINPPIRGSVHSSQRSNSGVAVQLLLEATSTRENLANVNRAVPDAPDSSRSSLATGSRGPVRSLCTVPLPNGNVYVTIVP